MELATYGVTNNRIRSLIGAEEEELTDEIIEGFALGDEVEVALASWLPEWQTYLDADPAAPVAPRIKLYLAYVAAAIAAQSAPAYLLRSWGDSEATGQRFDEEYASRVSGQLLSKATAHQSKTLSDLGLSRPVKAVNLLSGVSPSRDPVTTPRR